MILFFGYSDQKIIAVQVSKKPSESDLSKLTWLFGLKPLLEENAVEGTYIGPRASMITPWSTNAVEITQNMGLTYIERIEESGAENEIRDKIKAAISIAEPDDASS